MQNEYALMRGRDNIITPKLVVRQPTLEEVFDFGDRRAYYAAGVVCATPSQYKNFLRNKCELDWYEVEDFDFFLMLYKLLTDEDSEFLFGKNFRLSEFLPAISNGTGEKILYNSKTETTIDIAAYLSITEALREMYRLKYVREIPGDEAAAEMLLKKERRAIEIAAKEKRSDDDGYLLSLVSAMCNTADFKFDIHNVWSLGLFQFMNSVTRIQKIRRSAAIIQGIYSGTVDSDKISETELDWLGKITITEG